MSAVEAPRLYSRAQRVPVDVVAPQHEDVHADLERWGRWNRERMRSRGCASAESVYERTRTPGATIEEIDLRSVAIEKAIIGMPEDCRKTLRWYYFDAGYLCLKAARNRRPGMPCPTIAQIICWMLTLRYEAFPQWMFTCRAMVVNLLRRNANG